jgi:hypothetical protein
VWLAAAGVDSALGRVIRDGIRDSVDFAFLRSGMIRDFSLFSKWLKMAHSGRNSPVEENNITSLENKC